MFNQNCNKKSYFDKNYIRSCYKISTISIDTVSLYISTEYCSLDWTFAHVSVIFVNKIAGKSPRVKSNTSRNGTKIRQREFLKHRYINSPYRLLSLSNCRCSAVSSYSETSAFVLTVNVVKKKVSQSTATVTSITVMCFALLFTQSMSLDDL